MINGFNRPVAVYRDGPYPKTIHEGKLVVGDVYKVSNGDAVPADSILIEAIGIQCDESSLTGEAEQVSKIVGCPILSKTMVMTGQGKAIVVAVGANTHAGWIQENTQKGNEPTLLQEKLEVMALKIGNLGILCALLTFVGCVIRIYLEFTEIIPCGCQNVFTCVAEPDCQPLTFEFSTTNRLWISLLDTFIVLIALIVAAIPEGLPLAVSISLSFGC